MTKERRKVLAISGSVRKHSSNETILNIISGSFSDTLDVTFYRDIDKLPFFNPDLDNETVAEPVKTFRELIESADGVIICTPEYVFSLPGALKNALEWTVSTTVFSDKPFAFIVASGLGEKTFESLDLVMSTILQYKIPEKAKLLIRGARGKISANGEISDPKVIDEIRVVVDELILQMEGTPK